LQSFLPWHVSSAAQNPSRFAFKKQQAWIWGNHPKKLKIFTHFLVAVGGPPLKSIPVGIKINPTLPLTVSIQTLAS
jgi:hypothetical protein